MTVRILLQARLGSTRLPGKVMMPLGGTTVIKFMLRRLERTGYPVTACVPYDDLALHDHLAGYDVFRGSEDDVLKRMYDTMLGYEEDTICRVTGDSPLVDPAIIKAVIARHLTEDGRPYVGWANDPDGGDVEVFSRDMLYRAHTETLDEYDREHVCPWMARQPGAIKLGRDWSDTARNIDGFTQRELHYVKFSIDTQADLDRVRDMVRRIPDGTQIEYVEAAKEWDDLQKHKAIFPLGANVSSKSRMRFCEGSLDAPRWITRGDGAFVYDEQGRKFLDLTAGLGALTFGHRNKGRSDSAQCLPLPHRDELRLAEFIQHQIPWAQKMRLMKNGGDSTSAAIRLARVYTGRERVLDLGSYHGCQDPWITDDHEGVPQAVREQTLRGIIAKTEPLAPFELLYGSGEYAAVILEAAPLNPLPDGFLKWLRAACDHHGMVLIFDDVISGFRSHPQGAAGLTGVIPDLTCAGKAMANGFPISIVYGRGDIMDCFERTHLSATHWADPTCMRESLNCLRNMDAFYRQQAQWTFGGVKGNGHWSVLKLPMDEQTFVQRELMRAGIISNLSMFYYLDLDPYKERVEQAFADALGKLSEVRAKGIDITTLLDCEVNRTTFKRN